MSNREYDSFSFSLTNLLGLVFIISSIFKWIGLKTFALTVNDFCAFLGFDALCGHGIALAVLICSLEMMVGIAAFIQRLRTYIVWVYPIILGYFTYITYLNVLSLYGHIESCGCFGEVIHLTPEESFWKNVVMFAVSLATLVLTRTQSHQKGTIASVIKTNSAFSREKTIGSSGTRLNIITGVMLICLASCSNGLKDEIYAMMSKPLNTKSIDSDTIQNSSFRLISIHDSTECSLCAVNHLIDWDTLTDCLEQRNAKLVIVLSPKEDEFEQVKEALSQTVISGEVHLDPSSRLLEDNPQIPKNSLGHTFLIDRNNNVVLVGNPLYNPKIHELMINRMDSIIHDNK